MLLGTPTYFIGSVLREPFIFSIGLAIMIFGLTLMGNIMFHEWWVEEKEKAD